MDTAQQELTSDEERAIRRLRFQPELEREFREYRLAMNFRRIWTVAGLWIVIQIAGIALGGVGAPGNLSGTRDLIIILVMTGVFCLALIQKTRHFVQPAFALANIVVHIVMSMTVENPIPSGAVLINMMYAVIVVAALQAPFGLSLGFCLGLWCALRFGFVYRHIPSTVYDFPLTMASAILLFLCVSAYLNETRDRRSFLFLHSLRKEREKSHALVKSVLPPAIADLLSERSGVIAAHHESASVLFCDIVGFTPFASSKPPETVVGLLNDLFSRFDALLAKFHVLKVKTIGDCYMAASGIPEFNQDHVSQLADLALELRGTANAAGVDVRIGIHTGPVIAGVLGTERLMYDIWGPTVNMASRLEAASEAGCIVVSTQVKEALGETHEFEGPIDLDLKGLGLTRAWRLTRRKVRALALQ